MTLIHALIHEIICKQCDLFLIFLKVRFLISMEEKEKLNRKFICNETVKKKLKLFVNLNALILRLLKKEHLMRIMVLPSNVC